MRRGVGHLPLADQPVPPVGADVVLVAEQRDRQVDLRSPVLARLGPGVLDRPTRVPILLPQLGRLLLPPLRHAAFLDRLLLLLGGALLRGGDDRGVDQLSGHGQIAGGTEL
jgi:hypothetical protein